MKPRILVIGSANIDMVIQVPNIPKEGETVLGKDFNVAFGGKGANQALAAARAGGNVTFIGCLGNDSYGKEIVENLKKDGICTQYIKISEKKHTGVALIYVSDCGKNCIAVSSGANYELNSQDIFEIEPLFKDNDLILLQCEVPFEVNKAAIDVAKAYNKTVILNPAPAKIIEEDVLKKIDILTPNEHEALVIAKIEESTDKKNIQNIAENITYMGCKNVIITLGEKGALFANENENYIVPGFNVNAVDTTAAGDTFNGYLAYNIAKGYKMPEAITIANKAASLSVTRMGAQSSIPFSYELM